MRRSPAAWSFFARHMGSRCIPLDPHRHPEAGFSHIRGTPHSSAWDDSPATCSVLDYWCWSEQTCSGEKYTGFGSNAMVDVYASDAYRRMARRHLLSDQSTRPEQVRPTRLCPSMRSTMPALERVLQSMAPVGSRPGVVLRLECAASSWGIRQRWAYVRGTACAPDRDDNSHEPFWISGAGVI